MPFLVFYVVLSAKDGREILKFQASYYNCIAYAWPREDLEKKEAEIRAKIEEELGKKLNGITIKWGEYVRRGSHA
ncbi:MAG: hypothetical protein DRP09_16905 [Candidatus Thorarchaeota archaeon]|nr:MAG: hypothetical protein DRP09_16905 [Candidatus Thorarchaeota archaeon]